MAGLLAKLRWLLQSPEFQREPLRVMAKVLAWEWFRLRNKAVVYRFDRSFSVRLRPNEGVSRLTYYFGTSEPELFSFYDSFLREGMKVVDVGANIGLHSLFMAKRVGSSGGVYALEPSPYNFRRLETHVRENHLTNIRAFPIALGNVSGEAFLDENKQDSSRSRLTHRGSGSLVKVVRLDDFLKAECLGKVDFLKLDVEGFELRVLEGAETAFSESFCDVLQVELDPVNLARQDAMGTGVVSWLNQRGYQLARWDPLACKFRSPSADASCLYNSFFLSPVYAKKVLPTKDRVGDVS